MIEARSTHRKVMHCIHDNWRDGSPFAIHEIMKISGVSKSSTTRTLNFLRKINYLDHSTKAWRGRHYRVSLRWISVDDVIRDFEYAKAMRV